MMKLKTQYKNIEEYIKTFPKNVQDILQKMRQVIKEATPGAKEAIKYQMPTLVLKKNLVHFAAYKNHIGFYTTPSGIEAFKHELSQYESSKGAVRFPIGKNIPYDLVKKITKYRVKENLSR